MMDIALYLLSKKKPDKLDLYRVVLTVLHASFIKQYGHHVCSKFYRNE
jgi:hypothetical protein